jgi:catechol 2,3-dioxygenase-like lactoylglutathione lyase family enzyme
VKQAFERTGDHGIGQLLHVVHICDDVRRAREFYRAAFGAVAFMGVDEPSYLEAEDRYAALMVVGDLCVEVMAPGQPVDPAKPVGRFHGRFGQHLYSAAYRTDDPAGLAGRLIERGVTVIAPGGGRLAEPDPDVRYFFSSPRDTGGLLIEILDHGIPGDPRQEDSWSSLRRLWDHHPATVEGLSCLLLGVRDLESAVKTYVDTLQAVPVDAGDDVGMGARYRTVRLGDSLLWIGEPTDPDGDLGRHVGRYGNLIYGLRLAVRDLDAAVGWLAGHGVRTRRLRDGLVVTDVRDTFGAPIQLAADPS